MSDRSFKGWQRLPKSAASIFGCVDLALAQSTADAARLTELGCCQVVFAGNLKFDACPAEADSGKVEELSAAIGERPVWLAALTHPGEEEIVFAAHKALLERNGNRLLLLVPRHPARGDSVEALAVDAGFTVARRSRGEAPAAGAQVYLGDTLGEMALFYEIAPIAFLGGSFAEVGGHNPVEAAIHEAAILSGDRVANARPIYRTLWENGGARKLQDAKDLGDAVEALFQDEEERLRQVAAAAAVAESGRGALDRMLEQMAPILAKAGGGSSAGEKT